MNPNYFIEHINKQKLSKGLGFTSPQCITSDGCVIGFSDVVNYESKERFNVDKRELVVFDGVEWKYT